MLIEANWPLSQNKVGAVHTTRRGGYSQAPYHSLNFAYHVGDQRHHVDKNHNKVRQILQLKLPLHMVEQVHGSNCIEINQPYSVRKALPQADAIYTTTRGMPLCILTADCLPIFLADKTCSEIAIIHAGWRSLAQGIITNTLDHFKADPSNIAVYFGAAIGPQKFAVGQEVKQAFTAIDTKLEDAFIVQDQATVAKYLADLYRIAQILLQNHGITQFYSRSLCTYTEPELFYSYRRDHITGRMANISWLV